jgi:histidyl-tRNA synthetase
MIERVRGMRDILPKEASLWQALEGEIRRTFELYGYREIRPPVVELAELFSRTVGETTDIVHKEMYTFPDKKGQILALRPEATASVVRAALGAGLPSGDLQKFYYLGPMFRYEKPQAGRSRQFHQYGVEALGSLDPALDAEVIDLGWYLIERVGLGGTGILRLNSIGCAADRARYRQALLSYFTLHVEELCPACRRRLGENPMRILDCKQPTCQPVIQGAPRSVDYLCDACRDHFEAVQGYLGDLGLAYELDHTLVRGLDYYTRTVFELCSGELGAQDALLGGGRYDDLAELLGGAPTPGVGFAGGMERLVLARGHRSDEEAPELECFVVPVTQAEDIRRGAIQLLSSLRRAGFSADMDYLGRSLRTQLRVAGRRARYALILGPDELVQGGLRVRDLGSGAEKVVDLAQFQGDPRAFLG